MKGHRPFIGLGFLYLISMLTPTVLVAQDPAIKVYTINDGLPSTITRGAYQDRYGYLWISTPEGLSRFDGRQFVNYGIEDGLPSLNVSRIYQDSQERLWAGTNAGMAQFKNNKFVIYPTTDKRDNIYVTNFAETANKQLLALTSKGVYEFTGSTWKKISLFPGFENKSCRNYIEIDGEVYINYQQDIVCRDRDGKWRQIAQHVFFNVMSAQRGHLLVSSSSNVYEIRSHQLFPLFYKDMPFETDFSYMIDSKDRFWIAGYDFLKISKPGDWRHFSDSVEQYGGYTFVDEDSSHNVWVGSTEGLLKLKDLALSTLHEKKVSFLDGIYNIIPLPGNKFIFSSGTKYGLILHDSASDRLIKPASITKNADYYRDPVDAYAFDNKGKLWMATRFKKLLCFDGRTLGDRTKALHLKTSEHIYDITYAKKRKQLMVCADSTLLCETQSGFSTFIPKNTGIPIIKPTRIREIKNGLIVLYIDGKGVYSIDADNNLSSLIRETGINGSKKGIQLAICFYEDSNNNFWIAVPGSGIYEFGFGKSKIPFLIDHITTANGLQSNHIKSLTNDGQNRLWVVTNAGIDILQKNNSGQCNVFNYAVASDLAVDGCDFSKVESDALGNVWFSSPNKIIKFTSKDIRLSKESPQMIIEKATLSFKETDWKSLADSMHGYFELPYNPSMKYDQNSIGISFNAIDLSISNSNPEYSYKLLPLDTSWSIPSKTKSVSLTQLPAGDYTFIVRAKDKASEWSKPAVFEFSIKQPFWNEWWFRLIIITIAAAIIIGIFRARIRKVKSDAHIDNQLKELEMKALKAQMNPHFIYNALNSIQALIANDKKIEGIHYIGSFSRLLRRVLDNSESNAIGLDKELETIDLYIQLESLRLDLQLQYTINIDKNIVAEFEKIPPLILQPFVENALWHGLSRKEGTKQINIAISLEGNWLVCNITDNGIGRKKAQELKSSSLVVHQSKGIEITLKRLKEFNNSNWVAPIDFFDLYDAERNPLGTKVVLHIVRKSGSPF